MGVHTSAKLFKSLNDFLLIHEILFLLYINHLENRFFFGLQACRYRDALSSLNFISSEHPDLDACLSQSFNRDQHIVLKFVLDPRDGKEIHLFFQTGNNVLHQLLSVLHRSLSLL